MKVLVCDDREDLGKEIVKAIHEADQADIDVESLFGKCLTKALEILFENVKACLDDPKGYKVDGKLSFDAADVIIIDDNLTHLDIKGTRLTAESIAGYVRAFTSAPYVVSLNRNPDWDFDLRYLVGDYSTRADLALNTKHLTNRALWTGKRVDAKKGFLPWYWPALLKVGRRRREQIKFVQDHLDDPVCDTLEFPKVAVDVLSRHAKGALSPIARADREDGDDGIPVDEVAFHEFFLASSRSLPVEEERKKLSGEAMAGNKNVREIISRVVAADIDLWFRHDVVGPQEALVDVPHLLMRMPFLLGDKVGNLQAWKDAAVAEVAPFGMDQALFDKFLNTAMFKHNMWIRSPCFWWPEIRDTEKLNELFTASEIEWEDVVFCEDKSDFENRETKGRTPPKEFVAEFDSPWDRRYVKQLKDLKYAPRSRFAL